MRALPWRDRFDAALIWYTTFGYFDGAGNENVVQQAASAVRPGGRLLIEQINRAALLRQDLPVSFAIQRGGDLLIDLVSYDLRTDRTHTERITVREGRVRRATFSVRLYGFAEFTRLLRAAGFATVEAFGRDGEALELYGRRLIVLAAKPRLEAPAKSA